MRGGVFPTLLLAVAILLVFWLIRPPDFAGWAAKAREHRAERRARFHGEGEEGRREAGPALPMGALRLVAADGQAAVFLTGVAREGEGVVATTVMTVPESGGRMAPILVWDWRVDCAARAAYSRGTAAFDAGGEPLRKAAPPGRPQDQAIAFADLPSSHAEALRVACGGKPGGVPAVSVITAPAALAATPSLIASVKAMEPDRGDARSQTKRKSR